MNYVEQMVKNWIKERRERIEEAKKQIEKWEEIIEREENYITYLKTFIKNKQGDNNND